MSKQINKNNFYQDLPSIEPRVSRKERISMQGISDCVECRPASLKKARQSVKMSYSFFLFLVVLFFAFAFLQKAFIKEDAPEDTLIFTHKQNQTLTLSLVNQAPRYGISLLIRNNTDKEWNINNIMLQTTEFQTNIKLSLEIPRRKFVSEFIETPEISIDDISVKLD